MVQTQPVIPFLPHGVVADLADGGSASNGDCFVYSRSGTGRNGRRRWMVALASILLEAMGADPIGSGYGKS